MLTAIFLGVLQLSIQGSVLLALVLLLRVALRRLGAPRLLNHLLWCAVLFQLLCPLRIPLDLISINTPSVETAVTTATATLSDALPELLLGEPTTTQEAAAGRTDTAAATYDSDSTSTNAVAVQDAIASVATSTTGSNYILTLCALLWLCGVLALLLRGAAQYDYLRRHVRLAYRVVEHRKTYYTGTGVSTPFILGIVKPRIYLPPITDHTEKSYIHRHEQAHLAHGDFLLKPLFYLALCLHWYNPLVWFAMREMAKDIECACDETVLACFSDAIKPQYCSSLLRFAHAPRYATMPLCFGEGDFTRRIKDILNYKTPTFWAICSGAILAGALCLLCIINPFTSANGGDALQNNLDEVPTETIAVATSTPTASPAPTADSTPIAEDGELGDGDNTGDASNTPEPTASAVPSVIGMTAQEAAATFGAYYIFVPEDQDTTIDTSLTIGAYSEGEEITTPMSFFWPVPAYDYISRWTEAGVHNGIDIAADAGTAIYAAASGTVIAAGYNAAGTGYGYSVIIDHGDGYQTLYAHGLADSIQVSVGDSVSQGDLIMEVGSSGYSTDNHLHFELIINGVYIPFTEDLSFWNLS